VLFRNGSYSNFYPKAESIEILSVLANDQLSGLALGVTTATAIFGGLTSLVAHLLVTNNGWDAALEAMIAFVALCVITVFGICPRQRRLSPDLSWSLAQHNTGHGSNP